jgi:hypothetical protein
MLKKKAKIEVEILQIGKTYKLVKVWIKPGCISKVPVGAKDIKLAEVPMVSRPIMGKYDSEYPLSGDPKQVTYPASTTILAVRDIAPIGLRVETHTSVYLVLY